MPETTPDLRLTYIGGPTLRIEFGGITFLTDPAFDAAGTEHSSGAVVLSKAAAPAIAADALGQIDTILLSHDHHPDNLDQTGRDLLSHARQVITTVEGAVRLNGNAVGIAPWQAHEIAASENHILRITGPPAQHGPADQDRGPVTGFILELPEVSDSAIYISGDTVWFHGVEEVISRFPRIKAAILFLGAARIPIIPSHLTFTAAEAVRFAQALPEAAIIPVHFEGWKHFTESRPQITAAFAAAGLENRLHWLPPAQPTALAL